MTEIHRIHDQLQRAFAGQAWSGPSLLASLQHLTASQAAAHPVARAHSIWELVLHLTTWVKVVQQRLTTLQTQPVADAVDWPAQPARLDEEFWQQAVHQLRAAHEALLATVETLTDADLERVIAEPDSSEPSPRSTVYILLHGLAQHNLYHAGQIMLLRKALGL
ncbi:DinB family protein [Hymenobacter sp. BT635]|uniref:DinB family protein n=1 Tax=Hymenobacter nitidus TaxID=2880929 RepID=A0ABS8A9R8_9BACT|nr:DinB family protein [Hymenobacter nitidus]MCB2376144.1 DinB family protein [Hymenobacter nitidus]